MRIALAGKGGAGKTTCAATLARLYARAGSDVVAIDADSNPNLALALGVDRDAAARLHALPSGIVSRRLHGPGLVTPVDDVVDEHGVVGPDGVRVVLMGMPAHADEGCMCSAHATVSAVLADLGERPGAATIVDMEASPEHLSRGTTRHVDALVLVTEPYYRSLETTRRLASLAAELPIPSIGVLASKVRGEDDLAAVGEFCERHGLALLGAVPWDETVQTADRQGRPVIDVAPEAPVVEALSGLPARLTGVR